MCELRVKVDQAGNETSKCVEDEGTDSQGCRSEAVKVECDIRW
jgi:hypothetical protein